MVNGLPSLSCDTNNGITEPRDAITLPYRVAQKTVSPSTCIRALDTMVFSINALDIPIALIGYTALSVLSTTTRSTLFAIAAFITLSAPTTLVLTASNG